MLLTQLQGQIEYLKLIAPKRRVRHAVGDKQNFHNNKNIISDQ